MGFKDAIKTCYSKYATFSGRASKSEFWWFALLGVIVHLSLGWVRMLTMTANQASDKFLLLGSILIFLAAIFAVYFPWLSVGFRRLHDIGWPGWPISIVFLLIILQAVPSFFPFPTWLALVMGAANSGSVLMAVFATFVLNSAWLLLTAAAVFAYFLSRPSQPGPNKYGPPPPEVGA